MKNKFKTNNFFKNILTNNLDLPSSVIFDIPLITVIGNGKINIENFKNILEYSSSTIKILTSCGILKIEGKNLFLKELSKEKIFVKGKILKFEYIL